MVKFVEKGISKAESGQKPDTGLLYQTGSYIVKVKEKFLKEIKSATPLYT